MLHTNQGLNICDEDNGKKLNSSFIEEQNIHTPSQVLSLLQKPSSNAWVLQESEKIPNIVANKKILQEWYKNGPDYFTWENIPGQSIVKHIMIHGNFRKLWPKYVKSISWKIWEKLGYRFPYHIKGVVDDIGHTQLSNKAILEFFGDFDFESIRPFMRTQKRVIQETKSELDQKNISKNRLSNNLDPIYVQNMQKWYHVGYIDPQTQEHITGKMIIQQCVQTGNYSKKFVQYAQSLDKKYMNAIWFHFRSSMETIFSLMGILWNGMKLEILLTALWETDIDSIMKYIPKSHRYHTLSPKEYLKKLENWYYNGYISDNWKVVTGREIIIQCIQSKWAYWENFRTYINSLSAQESKNIGIEIHTSLRWIFMYLKKEPNGNILDFILMLGESKPEDIIKYMKRSLTGTKTKDTEKISQKSKPIFWEKIPENLRNGLKQCYFKIEKNMKDIVELKENDIWVLIQNNNYYIVFRTQKLIQIWRQYQWLIELFIEEANNLVSEMKSKMLPKNAKNIHCINFTLKLPDVNGNYF